MKSFGLIEFEEEVLKQSSIDCILWILVDMLMQSYNEQEDQEKLQNVEFEKNLGMRT